MLRSLARPAFIDQFWDGNTLDRAAKFWLQAYEDANHAPYKSDEGQQTIEFRVSGFARAARAAVVSELAKRLPDARVAEPDADTVVVTVGPRERTRLPSRRSSPATRPLLIRVHGSPTDATTTTAPRVWHSPPCCRTPSSSAS